MQGEEDEAYNGHDDVQTIEQGLVNCAESQSTGYRNGNPFPVTLIRIDGYLVEKTTGNAYALMQAAAAGNGVSMRINSGFRTPEEQLYLYNCYRNCNCNSCNLAAAPGYSNHQSGTALDLNTANSAVFNWLNANGGRFGFRRTVPSEPWHWEYFGGGPGGGPCSAPPPCDRSAGPFTFSCDGAESGMACVNVNEPSDPDTWNDNFFCSKGDFGMKWSHVGPIAGMQCANTAEGAEADPTIWADNYLCAPSQSPWTLSWSSAGPIAGRTCVHWNETVDKNSWHDNYLCTEPVYAFSNAGFTFTMNGQPSTGHCVNVTEPADPDTWNDNFFCSDSDIGMQWSHVGPIAGMACTNVNEGAEALASIWADNYLCVPETSFYRFHWSSAGPLAGLPCVRWFDHAESNPTWLDNWLCVEARGPVFEKLPPGQIEFTPIIETGETGEIPGTPGSGSGTGTPETGGSSSTELRGGCATVPALWPLLAAFWWLRRRRD